MTAMHDRWAVDRLIGDAGWIRDNITSAEATATAEATARFHLADSRHGSSEAFARGTYEGIRYSHPDGTTGVIPWARVPDLLAADTPEPRLF